MRSRNVTVKLTPRQAMAAHHALNHAAFALGDSRLFSAAQHIASGLYDSGWENELDEHEKTVWVRR